jgi:hypothetical protein
MKVIREVVTRGVTTLPSLKEISSRDLSEGKKAGTRFRFVTLIEETPDSWIVGSHHVSMWLYPLSGHSIELYRIGWSCFG